MHKTQTKQRMPKQKTKTKAYRDLEERTTNFAKRIVRLCKTLPKDKINYRLIDQIVRSGGSIGANYREANEALSKKDFIYRIRISRKETKETSHWLELIEEANPGFSMRMQDLYREAVELRSIFSAIIMKVENK